MREVLPDDGLLVRDLDVDGTIDSGRELFGSETLLPNGIKAANGFEALEALDTNTDDVIDAQDAAFAELRIWKDTNANGRTDAGELLTLADASVSSIDVAYANSSHTDAQGNAHRQVGSYTATSGETRAATDIWVQTNTTQSLPTDWVIVPEDIAALPDAQGYGLVRDLQQVLDAADARALLNTLQFHRGSQSFRRVRERTDLCRRRSMTHQTSLNHHSIHHTRKTQQWR